MKPYIDDECRQNPEEKKVVDERCYCGHLKSKHRDREFYTRLGGGLAWISEGHGSCRECDCSQFTWFGWVFSDGSEA